MIERILNALGYVKKRKERVILVAYNYIDGSTDIYGNVWYSTDKTGIDLLKDAFDRVKEAFMKANPGISEDQCPTIIISSISYLG